MKRKIWKRLLALCLMAGLLLGGLPETAQADHSVRAARNLTWTEAKAGNEGQAASQLLAKKNKKKKNSATPTPKAAEKADETAAPELTAAPVQAAPTATPVPEGPITDPQSIADYLFAHDMRLPENFVTKKEAKALGWDSSYNYVSDVAPGKSIGGDYFGNYEGKLPVEKGVTYREADCYYTGGRRNACRIIYSTAGRVWYTGDHYNTFEELFPSVK